jgi:hypothetical protein
MMAESGGQELVDGGKLTGRNARRDSVSISYQDRG